MIVIETPKDTTGALAGFRQNRRLSSRFFSLTELMEYLDVTDRYAAKKRMQGQGVPMVEFGQEILLADRQVEEWIMQNATSA